MNILVLCHYGMYQNLDSSFVHHQASAYAAMGHRVLALVPIALGRRGWTGSRVSAPSRQADGVEFFYPRFLSLSAFGKRRFNTVSAIAALKPRLPKLLKEFQPDVIHAHTLGFDSDVGAWLKEQLDCPLVVTTHGSDAAIPYERGESAYLRRCCDKADAVVAVSSALAGKLRRCGTATPIRSILNGFALDHLPSDLTKRPLTFLQVGQLQTQKRTHTTIGAFARVRAAHPEAALTIVGQGPERAALERLCQERGVADPVRFTGQIPNPNVLEEMAGSQFFILPSVREGFGIVYLEAMACGCVTIGTEGEGIAELIVHGENGFLVPPDEPDAIVDVVNWCLEHPEEAAAIAERGRRDARELTWEKNAEQYIELFKELLRHGSSHTG